MQFLRVFSLFILLSPPLMAQQAAPSAPQQQPPQKSISSQLGLHAFPAKNQTAEQQRGDEFACYGWSKQDSVFDPLSALEASQSAKASGTPSK